MKTIILLIWASVITTFCFGQERKEDVIRKMNGDSLKVFVINISEYDVTYSFPNEAFSYTVSKNVIRDIKFGSGRTEKITEPVFVNDESDWEEVTTTTVPSQIKGLTLKGDVSAKASLGGYRGAAALDKEMDTKIKKQAAAMQAHIILIESKTTQVNGSATVTGKAYGY